LQITQILNQMVALVTNFCKFHSADPKIQL
jgi:hypothetical protein